MECFWDDLGLAQAKLIKRNVANKNRKINSEKGSPHTWYREAGY